MTGPHYLGVPTWGGRLKADATLEVDGGTGNFVVPLDEGVYEGLDEDAVLLVSFAQDSDSGDGVDAWAYPIALDETGDPDPGPDPEPGPDPDPDPDPDPEPGTTTPIPNPGSGSTDGKTDSGKDSLAKTSAAVTVLLVAAVGMVAGGSALIKRSRRTNQLID